MQVYPVFAALRRHKAAAVLIILQIALTLAIVANALFVIGHTIEDLLRSSGVDEAGLLYVHQKLPLVTGDDATVIAKIDAMQQADLQAIRSLPQVRDAASTSGVPLLQGDGDGLVSLDAEHKLTSVHAGYYYGDEHLRATLGVPLVAGRDFYPSEISHGHAQPGSPVIIVTRALADALFPNGNALGQMVYQEGKPAQIIGIIAGLKTADADDTRWSANAVLEPMRANVYWCMYLVRVPVNAIAQATRSIHGALFALNPNRHMPPGAGIRAVTVVRADNNEDQVGMAALMGVICVILLSVTAAGIVGLTSFWVGQRRRQIGVRRALGARRVDILRYFQLENLLIAGGGSVLGSVCAVSLNLWLMKHYEMARLPMSWVGAGVVIMLLLGQLAVWVPARRASLVPPVAATRAG